MVVNGLPGWVDTGQLIEFPPLGAGSVNPQKGVADRPQGMPSFALVTENFFNNLPLGVGQLVKLIVHGLGGLVTPR